MNEIFGYIMFGIMVLLGGVPTIYIVISLPSTLIYKLFRKVKFGYKFTD